MEQKKGETEGDSGEESGLGHACVLRSFVFESVKVRCVVAGRL